MSRPNPEGAPLSSIHEVKPHTFIFEKHDALPGFLCDNMIERFEAATDEQYLGRIGQQMQEDRSIKKSTDLVVSGKEHWQDVDNNLFRSLGMALKEFREVAVAHSDSMPAFHALSYQYFIKDQAEDGFRVLERLAAALPASDRYGPYETHVLKWTGTLLGYSLLAGGSPPPREAVDRLVGQVRSRGPQATKICNDEYAAVRRLAERTADARARADLRTYAKFDFDAVEQYLRAGMKN